MPVFKTDDIVIRLLSICFLYNNKMLELSWKGRCKRFIMIQHTPAGWAVWLNCNAVKRMYRCVSMSAVNSFSTRRVYLPSLLAKAAVHIRYMDVVQDLIGAYNN